MAQYCTVEEISELGVNHAAISEIDLVKKQKAIAAASDEMDGYFSAQFKLPLISFGNDVRECCAVLAGIKALRVRGLNPDADRDILDQYDQKISWLRDISRAVVRPQVVDSSPGATVGVPSAGPRISSASSRGFSRLTPNFRCGGGSFGT